MSETLNFTFDDNGGLSCNGIFLGSVVRGSSDTEWFTYGADPQGGMEMDRLPTTYSSLEAAMHGLYDRLKYLFTGTLPMVDTTKLDAALQGLAQETAAIKAALEGLRGAGAAAQNAVDNAAAQVNAAVTTLTQAVG